MNTMHYFIKHVQERDGTLVSPSQKLDLDKDIMLGFICAHIVPRNNQMVKQCHESLRCHNANVPDEGASAWNKHRKLELVFSSILERSSEQFRTHLNTSREDMNWPMDLSFGLEDLPVLFERSSTEATFPQFQVTWMSLFVRCWVQRISLSAVNVFVCVSQHKSSPVRCTVAPLSVYALIQARLRCFFFKWQCTACNIIRRRYKYNSTRVYFESWHGGYGWMEGTVYCWWF